MTRDRFYIPHRASADALAYRAANKEKRQEIAFMAVCAQESAMGIQRDYQAKAWRDLAKIRAMPVDSALKRYRRKAKFYHELTRIAERRESLAKTPLPK